MNNTCDDIDLTKERLYSLNEITKMRLFPSVAKKHTIWEYCKRGRQSASGVTTYLECVKTPAGLATSREACRRFIISLNE